MEPKVRTDRRSFCFQTPGGRVSRRRLKAFFDLVSRGRDVNVMISRRQAIILRGDLSEIPDYQFRELNGKDLRGPNVKSFPYLPDSAVQTFWISRLTGLNRHLEIPLTCSYSPSPVKRAELVRDDLSVVRTEPGRYRLYSGAFDGKSQPLGPEFSHDNAKAMAEVMEHVIPELLPLADQKPRTVSRQILRQFNRKTLPSEDSPPVESNTTEIDEDSIYRSKMDGWIILPTLAGNLSPQDLENLVEFLEMAGAAEAILTPEQNLLVPVGGINREQVELYAREYSLKDSDSDYYARISTCPGASYCENARLDPIEMAARLRDTFVSEELERKRVRQVPIGITGCGVTTDLERLHPIGLAPNDEETGYDLYAGGTLVGWGMAGEPVARGLKSGDVPAMVVEELKSIAG